MKFRYDKGENWNKRQLAKELSKIHQFVYMPSDRFRRGIPDILFQDEDGKLCAIELKMKDKSWTKDWALQEYNLKQIGKKGSAYLFTIEQTDACTATAYGPRNNKYLENLCVNT